MTAFSILMCWSRWREATWNLSCRYTPIWFGARLRPGAGSVVARPTGLLSGIGWNRASQTTTVKSLGFWTWFKKHWAFALRGACWSGPHIGSFSRRGWRGLLRGKGPGALARSPQPDFFLRAATHN